jgi:hypothetical protein
LAADWSKVANAPYPGYPWQPALEPLRFWQPLSATGDDLYNLQPIAWTKLAAGELRGRDGVAIVLDDHAAREKLLSDEELLD